MKNREITFVLRLRNEAKSGVKGLGLDLRSIASQLKALEKSGGGGNRAAVKAIREEIQALDQLRRAKAASQGGRGGASGNAGVAAARAEYNERMRILRLARQEAALAEAQERTARIRQRTETEIARTSAAAARARSAQTRADNAAIQAAARAERASLDNARRRATVEQQAAAANERLASLRARNAQAQAAAEARAQRAQLQAASSLTRLDAQRAAAAAAQARASVGAQRAALGTQQAAARLAQTQARTQQQSAIAAQRLANANLSGQRAAVALQQQQLRLQQQQLRLQQQQNAAGGRGGGGALGRGVQGLAYQVAGAASIAGVIALADEYNMLQARIGLVTKSEAEHTAVMERLNRTALDTRVSLKSTADVYYSLARNNAALALTQNELFTVTDTLNKSIIVSGTSAQSANFALIQLGQAFGTGQLRGEELNSVLEQMPRLATALAKELGVGVPGALKTMAEAGKLTTDQVVQAILRASEEINREFAKIPITVGGGLQTLKTGFQILIGSFDDASGATQGLGRMFYDLGQWLASEEVRNGIAKVANDAAEVARIVGGALSNAFAFVQRHATEFKVALAVLTGIMAGSFVANGVSKAIAAVSTFAGGLRTLVTAMRGVQVAAVATGAATTVALGPISIAIGLIVAAVVACIGVFFMFRDQIMSAVAGLKAVWDTYFKAMFDKVVEGVKNFVEIAKIMFGVWVEDQRQKLSALGNFFAAFFGAILRAVKFFINMFIRGWLVAPMAIYAAFKAMRDNVGRVWNNMVEMAKSAGSAIKNFFTGNWGEALANAKRFGAAWNDNMDAALDVSNAVGGAIQNVYGRDFVGEAIGGLEEGLGQLRDLGARMAGTYQDGYDAELARRRAEDRGEGPAYDGWDERPDRLPRPPGDGDDDAAKRRRNEWEQLLKTINPALARQKEYNDAMALLNRHVTAGSAEWNRYKEAIERAYGAMATPLAKANEELDEQIRLLGMVNDAERSRAEQVARLMKEVAEDDPNNMAGIDRDVERRRFEARLMQRDRMEFMNQAIVRGQEAVAIAQQEYNLQLLQGVNLAEMQFIYDAYNEAKRQGLDYTLEEVRALLETQGILDQIREAETIRIRMDADPVRGAIMALQNEFSSLSKMGKNVGDVIQNAFNGAADAITEFAMTGKMDFRSFVSSMISDIMKLITKILLMQAIGWGIDAVFGPGTFRMLLNLGQIGQAVVSAGASAPASAPSAGGRMAVNHTGGIAGQAAANTRTMNMAAFAGARRYHTGGIVGAGLKRGEVPIIAEKNEAVLPTVRMPDGNLGIRATGGGGGNTVILQPQIPITVTIEGGAGQGGGNDLESARSSGAEIGRQVDAAMTDWANRQSRPGGVLYNLRSK